PAALRSRLLLRDVRPAVAAPLAGVVISSRDAHPVDRVVDARRDRCDAVSQETARLRRARVVRGP
ncbi:MAG TPA: hypothetical protein VIH08_00745, partial [Blastococcus sp.]